MLLSRSRYFLVVSITWAQVNTQGGSCSVLSLKMKTVESYWAVLSRESVSVVLTATFLVKNKNGLNAYGCFRQEEDEIIQHVFRPIISFLLTFLFIREINIGERQLEPAVCCRSETTKGLTSQVFHERKKTCLHVVKGKRNKWRQIGPVNCHLCHVR